MHPEIQTNEYKKKTNDFQTKLWMIYVCYTGILTVNSSRYSYGRTPIEYITGDAPDASEYIVLELTIGCKEWRTLKTIDEY